MLASDHKNTVFSEVRKDGRHDAAYTAYGDSASAGSLGYNGERSEAQTGWYLLGNGYRAYNAGLMRFHSPDRLSPFGEGGINAYMYCGGNPIDFFDPTGSYFSWVAKAGSWLSKLFSSGGAKAARNSLDRVDLKMFEPATDAGAKVAKNAGAEVAKNAGAKVSSAAKSSGRSVPKGQVNNGEVKGGFWAGLKNNQIKTKPISVTEKSLAPRAPVRGPKFGEALGNPSSGATRLNSRATKSWLQDDVVARHLPETSKQPSMFQNSMHNVRQGAGQAEEARNSLNGNVGK